MAGGYNQPKLTAKKLFIIILIWLILVLLLY